MDHEWGIRHKGIERMAKLPTIQVPLPPEIFAAVDAAAERAGKTRAEWVRRAIAAKLRAPVPEMSVGRPAREPDPET